MGENKSKKPAGETRLETVVVSRDGERSLERRGTDWHAEADIRARDALDKGGWIPPKKQVH